jgi:phosphoribosylglycinamide formyltransferase 1
MTPKQAALRPRLGVLLGERPDLLEALRQSAGAVVAVACDSASTLDQVAHSAPAILLEGHGVRDRKAREAQVAAWFDSHRVEWLVTAGWLWLLSPELLRHFAYRAVNVHPTLLPAYPGRHSVERAIAAGHRPLGATVHLIDDGVDTGPVIAQRVLRDEPASASEARRLLAPLEAALLRDAVAGLTATPPLTATPRP